MSWNKPNHIFGPVPSRRLGFSLGVDVIPRKLCTLDCVYCEVCKTTGNVLVRKEYVPARTVLGELAAALSVQSRVDWISFSGSGEPTLNSKLGEMIHASKEMTDIPVAVITNGTLLSLPEVRHDLLGADAVLPSLDAASQDVFEKINRPHPSLRIEKIIEGLRSFRREYSGQIWLEILFVKGINDGEAEIRLLKEAIEQIHPDKVQLNTVVRPPAEPDAEALGRQRMEEIREFFGEGCEIIAACNPGTGGDYAVLPARKIDAEAVLSMVKRRPVTLPEISAALDVEASQLLSLLDELEKKGLTGRVRFEGGEYYH